MIKNHDSFDVNILKTIKNKFNKKYIKSLQ